MNEIFIAVRPAYDEYDPPSMDAFLTEKAARNHVEEHLSGDLEWFEEDHNMWTDGNGGYWFVEKVTINK